MEVKRQHQWAEKKDRVEMLATRSIMVQAIRNRKETIENTMKLTSMIGAALIERIESDKYKATMKDVLMAVQSFVLLTTNPPCKEYENLNELDRIAREIERGDPSRRLFEDIIDNGSPEEKELITKLKDAYYNRAEERERRILEELELV
ncbi:MAG: hypothetical protein HQK53_13315 [Oligoflexia bacterium]|nr:hypothetical protein [Oligoflexia bacterium]